MAIIYLGLGTNLGDREANLDNVLEELERSGVRVLKVSFRYVTQPEGHTPQPDFLNMAAKAETELSPAELLSICKKIEKRLGREEGGVRWGPRTIDIDILLYEDRIIKTRKLEIPHPRLKERAFALVPLLEIESGLTDPESGKPFSEYLRMLPEEIVKSIRKYSVNS